jgi:hypothetical protein
VAASAAATAGATGAPSGPGLPTGTAPRASAEPTLTPAGVTAPPTRPAAPATARRTDQEVWHDLQQAGRLRHRLVTRDAKRIGRLVQADAARRRQWAGALGRILRSLQSLQDLVGQPGPEAAPADASSCAAAG